jgi:hypothetical protein
VPVLAARVASVLPFPCPALLCVGVVHVSQGRIQASILPKRLHLIPYGIAVLSGMSYRDLLKAFWGEFTGSNRLDLLECLCEIVAIPARVTDTNDDILKDYKTGLVLKSFAVHALRTHRSLAVFTPITELCRHILGSVIS